jgi:hypothetical protein
MRDGARFAEEDGDDGGAADALVAAGEVVAGAVVLLATRRVARVRVLARGPLRLGEAQAGEGDRDLRPRLDDHPDAGVALRRLQEHADGPVPGGVDLRSGRAAGLVAPGADLDEVAGVAAAGDIGHRVDADDVLPRGDLVVTGAVDRHERGRGRRPDGRAHVRRRGSGGVGGTAGGDGGEESGEDEEQRDAHGCHTCEIGCNAHRLSERG